VFDPPPSRIDLLTTWLPRIAVAVAFVSLGIDKFSSDSTWVRLFDQIGFGQWFRYVTGAIQLAGGVLVLIPRTCLAGLALLGCTMAGAVLVWVFVLNTPGNAVIPAAILGGLVVVTLRERNAA
jgi:putative oxidoreductase